MDGWRLLCDGRILHVEGLFGGEIILRRWGGKFAQASEIMGAISMLAFYQWFLTKNSPRARESFRHARMSPLFGGIPDLTTSIP